MNTELCNRWAADPLVNPITNRAIRLNGPTYVSLRGACEKLSGEGPLKDPVIGKQTDGLDEAVCKEW